MSTTAARQDSPVRTIESLLELLAERGDEADFHDRYDFWLTPTLAMLDAQAKPLAAPLVGYGSRDFYGAYLEEQIQNARIYWQNRRS